MPRHGRIPPRLIEPDPIYNSVVVAKFVNKILRKGKKSVAERIMYDALKILGEKTKKPPLEVFEKAMNNVKPLMEVKPRRVGGATYQVPVEVRQDRAVALAMRWILEGAEARNGKTYQDKLAGELLEAYEGTGTAMKKREDAHKMAEANKAFAHFRW